MATCLQPELSSGVRPILGYPHLTLFLKMASQAHVQYVSLAMQMIVHPHDGWRRQRPPPHRESGVPLQIDLSKLAPLACVDQPGLTLPSAPTEFGIPKLFGHFDQNLLENRDKKISFE